MYIKTTISPTTKRIQVYLIKAYRNEMGQPRQEIIKNYGELGELQRDNPNILEDLRAEAKRLTNEENAKTKIQLEISLEEKLSHSSGEELKNFGWTFLDKIYDELEIKSVVNHYSKGKKFKFNLDTMLRFLCYSRIINPSSKRKMQDERNEIFGNWDMSLDDIYRGLDHLEKIKDQIQLKIHNTITQKYGRECSFVFYDVTNYYKSTDITSNCFDEVTEEIIEENLMQYGMSKEKRRRPIVQMGLFMDSNGIPICYKLFRGNLPDVKTFSPFIQHVKEKYGFEKVICVADKAMNSAENKDLMLKNGDSYIFSQKIRGTVNKKYKDFAYNKKGWQWNKDRTFRVKSKIIPRKVDGKLVDERVVAVYSVASAKRQAYQREELIKKAEEMLKQDQNQLRRMNKVSAKLPIAKVEHDKESGEISPKQDIFVMNYQRIEDLKTWEGLNMIISSETKMTAWEILGQYQELWQIEETFKISKSDLEGRPIYHRLDERIQGHFLTCFISLVLIRLLQKRTDGVLSKDRLINAIKDANCIHLSGQYYRNCSSKDSVKVAQYFNANIEQKYLTASKLRSI